MRPAHKEMVVMEKTLLTALESLGRAAPCRASQVGQESEGVGGKCAQELLLQSLARSRRGPVCSAALAHFWKASRMRSVGSGG